MSSRRPDITILSDPRLNPESNRVLHQADILRTSLETPLNTVNPPLMISSAFRDGSLVFVTHPYRQFRQAIERSVAFNDPHGLETSEALQHEDIGWDYQVELAIRRASLEAGRQGLELVGADLLVPELFNSPSIQSIIRSHSDLTPATGDSAARIQPIIAEGRRVITKSRRIYTVV